MKQEGGWWVCGHAIRVGIRRLLFVRGHRGQEEDLDRLKNWIKAN